MIELFNLFSLVFGLIAWTFPVVNLIRCKKQHRRNWVVFSIMSISACAVSLCLQIFYNHHLVKIEDWSALMDTTGAIAVVASILLVTTIMLNVITLIVYRDRTEK